MTDGRMQYVTAEVDQGRMVVATHHPCGCPLYAEDMLRGWECEHGNYFVAAT